MILAEQGRAPVARQTFQRNRQIVIQQQQFVDCDARGGQRIGQQNQFLAHVAATAQVRAVEDKGVQVVHAGQGGIAVGGQAGRGIQHQKEAVRQKGVIGAAPALSVELAQQRQNIARATERAQDNNHAAFGGNGCGGFPSHIQNLAMVIQRAGDPEQAHATRQSLQRGKAKAVGGRVRRGQHTVGQQGGVIALPDQIDQKLDAAAPAHAEANVDNLTVAGQNLREKRIAQGAGIEEFLIEQAKRVPKIGTEIVRTVAKEQVGQAGRAIRQVEPLQRNRIPLGNGAGFFRPVLQRFGKGVGGLGESQGIHGAATFCLASNWPQCGRGQTMGKAGANQPAFAGMALLE